MNKVIHCVRGVVSPLLANLFLHYAFDEWMRRNHAGILFERYADDAIVHCQTEDQAKWIRGEIEHRLEQCYLELHPQKTRIVYCKDDDRKGSYPDESFDFLGFTFRPRRSKNRWGKYFINFSPAVSNRAVKEMRQRLRKWKLHLRSDKDLEDLARMVNPTLQGWMNYYGSFYKSALYPVFINLNRTLTRWATRKYKRLRGHRRRATHWLGRIAQREPVMFAHWKWGLHPSVGR